MKNPDVSCINCAGSNKIEKELKRFHDRIMQSITAIEIISNSDVDMVEIHWAMKCPIREAYAALEAMQDHIGSARPVNEH